MSVNVQRLTGNRYKSHIRASKAVLATFYVLIGSFRKIKGNKSQGKSDCSEQFIFFYIFHLSLNMEFKHRVGRGDRTKITYHDSSGHFYDMPCVSRHIISSRGKTSQQQKKKTVKLNLTILFFN